MRIIPDETSLYLYLMKYVVKPETMSKSLSETIKEACDNVHSVVSGKASTLTTKPYHNSINLFNSTKIFCY